MAEDAPTETEAPKKVFDIFKPKAGRKRPAETSEAEGSPNLKGTEKTQSGAKLIWRVTHQICSKASSIRLVRAAGVNYFTRSSTLQISPRSVGSSNRRTKQKGKSSLHKSRYLRHSMPPHWTT
eukprot:TRINITY_DN14781_c0_g1_i3.p1 TRINITY_DN14781_c0_g1~~TRINITY_DN14781_c0_g1_i3.p1  ORF type:complete len:133 (-),score=13.21 TRINITY_DN14781_c0_g1_i3:519-887(-)